MYEFNLYNKKVRMAKRNFDAVTVDVACRKVLQTIYETLGENNVSIKLIDDFFSYCKDRYEDISIPNLQSEVIKELNKKANEWKSTLVSGQTATAETTDEQTNEVET